MPCVFGPVASRRLGVSLGVDLVRAKTWSYDCLYGQVGRTTDQVVEPRSLLPVRQILQELKQSFPNVKPDTISFSGRGEPTRHPQIDEVIAFVKARTTVQTTVLTNGFLLWRADVRVRVAEARIVMPNLTTACEETFKANHRPHPEPQRDRIIAGLKEFRKAYRGKRWLGVVLPAGYKDSRRKTEALRQVVQEVAPDKIQLNTVARPRVDPKGVALDRERPAAEIVASSPRPQDGQGEGLLAEVEAMMKGLLIKGRLGQREFAREAYYIERDREQRPF